MMRGRWDLLLAGGAIAVLSLVLLLNEEERSALTAPRSDKVQSDVRSEPVSNVLALAKKAVNARAEKQSQESPSRLLRPPIESFVRREAAKLGHVDPNPEKTQMRLKTFARGLNSQEMRRLQEMSLNPDLNGDQRFLSVYILSLRKSGRADKVLKSVALAPIQISASQSPRLYDQEVVIRTQALEGLAQQTHVTRHDLQGLLVQIDDPLIRRHIKRLVETTP